jgi:hypothetical protein
VPEATSTVFMPRKSTPTYDKAHYLQASTSVRQPVPSPTAWSSTGVANAAWSFDIACMSRPVQVVREGPLNGEASALSVASWQQA